MFTECVFYCFTGNDLLPIVVLVVLCIASRVDGNFGIFEPDALRVVDDTKLFAAQLDIFEVQTADRLFLKSLDVECAADTIIIRSIVGVDVADGDIFYAGHRLIVADRCQQSLPGVGNLTGVTFRQGTIAVSRIPVQEQMERILHVGHFQTIYSDVANVAAAGNRRLDTEAAVRSVVVQIFQSDIVDTAGNLAADGDTESGKDRAVLHGDVMARTANADAIAVTTGLDANTVIVAGCYAVFNQNVVTGVDVDTVCAGAVCATGSNFHTVNVNVVAVANVEVPETGAGGSYVL